MINLPVREALPSPFGHALKYNAPSRSSPTILAGPAVAVVIPAALTLVGETAVKVMEEGVKGPPDASPVLSRVRSLVLMPMVGLAVAALLLMMTSSSFNACGMLSLEKGLD